jgi:hypothetical protein
MRPLLINPFSNIELTVVRMNLVCEKTPVPQRVPVMAESFTGPLAQLEAADLELRASAGRPKGSTVAP